jgi:hypothetical protein
MALSLPLIKGKPFKIQLKAGVCNRPLVDPSVVRAR